MYTSWKMGRFKRESLCCRSNKEGAYKKKATPLPKTKLFVVCATLFVSQYGMNMIFPFLPFMVHDFFPSLDKQELGRKAGFLGSAYFIGNFVGSLLWGWLADVLGRRPILLLGVCGIISSELLFGFSQNFVWAVIARLLWGMLNGNVGVVKTYISEICDDSNQAKGFAVIGVTGGIGKLTGSITGGFLAQPASKYRVLQTAFFCKFPYSLPCLVGAGLSFLSLIVGWLFLDETLHKKKKRPSEDEHSDDGKEKTLSSGTSLSSNEDSGISLSPTNQSTDDSDTEMIDLTAAVSDCDDDGIEITAIAESDIDTESDFETVTSDTELLVRAHGNLQRELNTNPYQRKALNILSSLNPLPVFIKIKDRLAECLRTFVVCFTCIASCKLCVRLKRGQACTLQGCKRGLVSRLKQVGQMLWRRVRLLRDRRVFLAVSLYTLAALIFIISNELLPLLLVTSHAHGGYDMDDTEIGIILMVAAVFQLLWQLFLFPRIASCIGYRRSYQFGAIVFCIAIILPPLANRITGPVPGFLPGSGGGSGGGYDEGLIFGSNSSDIDFCGNDLSNGSISVNENSVARVPFYIWLVVCLVTAFIIVGRIMTITSVMVLIGNSALPADRATVNGIGQAGAALGRTLGPAIGAPIFAWSESNGKGWPLNYHFMFDLMAVLSVGVVVVSCFMPKTIEKKRDTLESEATQITDTDNQNVASVGVASVGVASESVANEGVAIEGVASVGVAIEGVASEGVAIVSGYVASHNADTESTVTQSESMASTVRVTGIAGR